MDFQHRSPMGQTVPEAIHRAAQENSGGFHFMRLNREKRFLSFETLVHLMKEVGQKLLGLGLQKGDTLGLILPENDDFVLAFLSALEVGLVPVPLYPPLSFGKLDTYIQSTAEMLDRAEAKVLLTDAKAEKILWSLVDRVPSLQTLKCFEQWSTWPKVEEYPKVEPKDLAFLQYTSGSTSKPKGVMVTHGSLMANLHGIMDHGLKIDPQSDVAVSWLPLYHDMGLIGFMLAPACYGVTTHYLPTLHFIKHPRSWMETMSKHRGTISFAPNFAYALAVRRTSAQQVQSMDLSSVRVLGCGAEPNHPQTLQTFVDHFKAAGLKPEALLPSYGMAEATLAITFAGLDSPMKVDHIDRELYEIQAIATPSKEKDVLSFVSCGQPFPNHEVRIYREDGTEALEREVGEIWFSGPSLTKGYYRNPEATAQAFQKGGLLTGDLGYIADGELYVTGRKKDLIILNGRNYDPQSIEWLVAEIPGVRKGNVVAFSIPQTQTEALIVVAEIRDFSQKQRLEQEIKQAISDQMRLSVWDLLLLGPGSLPKTTSGKLQRQLTRQQYLEGRLGKEGIRTMGHRGHQWILGKHFAHSMLSKTKHKIRDQAVHWLKRFKKS